MIEVAHPSQLEVNIHSKAEMSTPVWQRLQPLDCDFTQGGQQVGKYRHLGFTMVDLDELNDFE